MATTKQCCPTNVKPAINNYKGTGEKVTLENVFDMYVTGTATTKKKTYAVVLVYDIFGWTSNSEQLADRLKESMNGDDCVVCMPDFMRGRGWDPTNIPPTKDGKFPEGVEPEDGINPLFNWIMTHPTCNFDRNDEIQKVKEYLVNTYQVEKIGMVGICWGGKVTFLAAKEQGLVDAIATCHGSLLEKADAEAVTVPVCMLDSKEEPETYKTELRPVLQEKSNLSLFKDFPTMHHGWMGTRGVGSDTDFGDDEVRKQYAQGVMDLVNFFTKVFAA